MKKPLLLGIIGLTIAILTATTLYAQTTTGTSIIDKMKATIHAFTLGAQLSQTGLESSPIAGKKTGDILTAGEWNRVLELVSEGGSSGTVNYMQLTTPASVTFAEGGKVPFTTVVSQKGTQITQNGGEITLKGGSSYMISADIRITSANAALGYTIINKSDGTGVGVYGANYTGIYTDSWTATSAIGFVSPTVDTTYFVRTSSLSGAPISNHTGGNFTVWELGGGGSSDSGSSWVNVPLDAAEFDKSCEYRFQVITPTNKADDPYMGDDPYHYVNAVDNNRLTWFILPGEYHHINFDSKTIYRVNGVPYTDVTISKLEKLCGGGGGSASGGTGEMVMSEMSPTTYSNLIDAVNYCRNLTENGITNWKFPTYGDLVNFISSTYSDDFLWVADFDGTQTASHSITKNYFGSIRLSDGYWSVSTPADGPNKVRCVAQKSGGSTTSSWVDVLPLTDVTDFDPSCEYKVTMNYISGPNSVWMGASSGSHLATGISTKYLSFVFGGTDVYGIRSTNKNQYGYRNLSGTYTQSTEVQVTKLQKRCN